MKLIALTAIGVGGLVALASGTAVATYTLAAQADVVVTATVLNHPDGGHGTPSLWARDTFKITVTIHETTPNHFTLTTVDHGSFTADKCATCSPNAGAAIKHKVTGAFHGTETGAAVGTLKSPAAIAALNGKTIDDKNAVDGPSSTFHSETWFQRFFNAGVTGSPSSAGYTFTYKTVDEQWIDSNTNNDGHVPAAGDITGKLSSDLVVLNKCRLSKTDPRNRWTVKNVRGDRAVGFTYRVSYHGKWSKVASAAVPAGSSTELTTATGGVLAVRYLDGYGAVKHASARSPKPPVYC